MTNLRRPGSSNNRCWICGSSHLERFYRLSGVPVQCNRLWSDREEAKSCRRGEIELVFCPECGFIANAAFDHSLTEYGQEYENSLHYSPHFRRYARALAQTLIGRYHLRDKDIIDIGCGRGDFLVMLCQMGNNRGRGFDTSYLRRRDWERGEVDVRFIQDHYSSRYADWGAHLFCCRQVLEHVRDPKGLLETVRVASGKGSNTRLFFEVPNARYMLEKFFIWDIIYEHCSYFAAASLSYLLLSCGFEVREIREEFGGQYLAVHAAPTDPSGDTTALPSRETQKLALAVACFRRGYHRQLASWRAEIERLVLSGKRAVIWGAGSKGVSFLNILGLGEQIQYAVDINPNKQGMYVAGTGHKIVPPESLKEYKPDVVIVMNPLYKEEINMMLETLGLNPDLMYL